MTDSVSFDEFIKDESIIKFPALFLQKGDDPVRVWYIGVKGDTWMSYSGTYGGVMKPESGKGTIKNKGNSNEVSPEQNALAIAHTKWDTKKTKNGYEEEVIDLNIQYPLAPMLATGMDKILVKKTKKFDWNKEYIVQPKLDGHRCTASWRNGKVMLHTRGRKEYQFLDLIRLQLSDVFLSISDSYRESVFFDGELYVHGDMRETIASIVRRTKNNKDCKDVKYYIYDMLVRVNGGENMIYKDRFDTLKGFVGNNMSNVKVIDSYIMTGEENIKVALEASKNNGYEGIMIKFPENIYVPGKRSLTMIKLKPELNIDCVIVGYSEGKDSAKGTVIFACSRGSDYPIFNCVPCCTYEKKKEMFQKGDSYIGKFCVVRCYSINSYGTPEFANITEIKEN